MKACRSSIVVRRMGSTVFILKGSMIVFMRLKIMESVHYRSDSALARRITAPRLVLFHVSWENIRKEYDLRERWLRSRSVQV